MAKKQSDISYIRDELNRPIEERREEMLREAKEEKATKEPTQEQQALDDITLAAAEDVRQREAQEAPVTQGQLQVLTAVRDSEIRGLKAQVQALEESLGGDEEELTEESLQPDDDKWEFSVYEQPYEEDANTEAEKIQWGEIVLRPFSNTSGVLTAVDKKYIQPVAGTTGHLLSPVWMPKFRAMWDMLEVTTDKVKIFGEQAKVAGAYIAGEAKTTVGVDGLTWSAGTSTDFAYWESDAITEDSYVYLKVDRLNDDVTIVLKAILPDGTGEETDYEEVFPLYFLPWLSGDEDKIDKHNIIDMRTSVHWLAGA